MRNNCRSLLLGILPPVLLIAAPAAAQWPPEGVAICTAPGTQTQPVAVPDGAGGAIIAWVDSRDLATTGRDVYAQHITGAGQIAPGWPANGVPLCTATHDQNVLSLVSDGAGGAIAAWLDYRNSPDGLTNVALYVQRVLGTGSIAPGWPADGVSVTGVPVVRSSLIPSYQLAADGQGGALLAWDADVTDNIDVQRIGASGVVAPGWPADGIVVAQHVADDPKLTGDGSGGCFVGWTDGGLNRCFMQRIGASGVVAPGWPSGGVTVMTPGCCVYHTLGVAADAQGGAFMVSLGDEFCSFSIVGRLDSTGNLPPGWSASGNFVPANECGIVTQDYHVLGDGAGNLFLGWAETEDNSLVSAYNVALEKLNAAGAVAPGWPEYPIFVGDTTGAQSSPQMTLDGQGGVLLTWIDGRSDPRLTRIDAQRVTSAGAVAAGWAPGGTPVCASDSAQGIPAIASDGSGGAIIALLDKRNAAATGIDVYAQRLLADGTVPVAAVETEPARGFAMAVGPNPTTDALSVSFTLPREGPVALELLDPGGRRVARRVLGPLGAGGHAFRWNIEPPPGAGVYWVRVTQAGKSAARRVSILR